MVRRGAKPWCKTSDVDRGDENLPPPPTTTTTLNRRRGFPIFSPSLKSCPEWNMHRFWNLLSNILLRNCFRVHPVRRTFAQACGDSKETALYKYFKVLRLMLKPCGWSNFKNAVFKKPAMEVRQLKQFCISTGRPVSTSEGEGLNPRQI